jgi:DNA-binding transcriptional LysR family regulator
MSDLDDLVRIARSSSIGAVGSLCVGVVSSIAGGTARDLLRSFLAAHDDVDLQVVEGSPRVHVGNIRALKMDLCFVVGNPPAPGCVVEPLWSEPILVAFADDHRLAAGGVIEWTQLVSERFIVSNADPGPEINDYVVKQMSELGLHPIVEPRPVRRDGLMALVGLGRGVSLVGAAEAAVTYPGVVFRPIHDEMLPFSVVWSEQNDNPVLRRFLSLARQHGVDPTLVTPAAILSGC